MSDSEIADLCRRIYRKHQQALDLIYEHRPDRAALVYEALLTVLGQDEAVLMDHCTKSYIRFLPRDWDLPQLSAGDGWTPSGRMLLFEFRNDYRGITLQLQLGPGPLEVREALFQAAQESSVLKPQSKALNKKWNNIYPGRLVVSAASLEELDGEEVESRVSEFWSSFQADELGALIAELGPVIGSLPPRGLVVEPNGQQPSRRGGRRLAV